MGNARGTARMASRRALAVLCNEIPVRSLTWPNHSGVLDGKRVAELVIETLQTAGVKTCYGIVGDTMNRIAQAIDRSAID